MPSGSGISVASTIASSTLSRASVSCSICRTRSSRVRRSAVSSSRVSNSLASCANSSSASGSSRSLTAVTVTVTSASRSLYSPGHQRGGERGRLAGGQPGDRLVDAVDEPALADLVRTARWSAASSTASPSTVAARSIWTKSSFAAARSTPVRVAKRARRLSSASSTSASVTAASSTCTASDDSSGSVISGRTSTSAVNARRSLSAISVTSISGCPSGDTSSAEVTASEYFVGIASLTTCSSTTPRPRRASMMRAGTLPLRKPGTLTCWAIFLYARSKSGFSSSKGTSTLIRTLVGLSRSTVLFTSRYSSIGFLFSGSARTGDRHTTSSESRRDPGRDGDLGRPSPRRRRSRPRRPDRARSTTAAPSSSASRGSGTPMRAITAISTGSPSSSGSRTPDDAASGQVGGDGAERAAGQSRDAGVGEHGRGDGFGEGGILGHAATVSALVALG